MSAYNMSLHAILISAPLAVAVQLKSKLFGLQLRLMTACCARVMSMLYVNRVSTATPARLWLSWAWLRLWRIRVGGLYGLVRAAPSPLGGVGFTAARFARTVHLHPTAAFERMQRKKKQHAASFFFETANLHAGVWDFALCAIARTPALVVGIVLRCEDKRLYVIATTFIHPP